MTTVDPGLTGPQIDVVGVLERVTSVFSLLGSMVVITTFTFSRAFHKPINRLVFYATFGNLLTNVATLMGRSFVSDINQAGCQFQAFLIQTFMPADAFWMLAMALNVHLTFYFKFDARQLRRMEVPYFLLCYGIPFIVALVLVFVSTPDKGRMYGNATLWCWIAPKWDIFRIAIFYGPVWIVILITFSIYIRAGREIYKKHKQLKEFSFSTSHHDPEPFHAIEDLFSSTKTTEVYVTTEVIDKPGSIDLARLGAGERRQSQGASPQRPSKAAYSVTISSHRHGDNNADGQQPQQQRQQQQVQTTITADPQAAGPGLTRVTTNTHNNNNNNNDTHPLTATTTNAATNTNNNQHPSQNPTQTQTSNPLRRRAAYEATNATWSYTKCALLFFTAMLVTWIPSSANRVFSVVHAGQTSLPLEYMSAFVLPLQGFWNAIIYCVTSWGACRMLAADVRSWWSRAGMGSGGRRGRGRGGGAERDGDEVGLHLGRSSRSAFHVMGSVRKTSDSSKAYETESMTELAASRPGSSGSPAMLGGTTPLPPPQTAKMGV